MIGNKIFEFQTLESTNDYIKQNLKELKNGDIVVSKTQTKGRGRRGNTWASEEGNLYFSFLIDDYANTYNNIFDVLMKVSVSLVETLESHGIEAKIKYPNDIIVKNKKIAGILVETIGNERPNHLIVGIGLNVNQNDFSKININATSLLNVNKEKYNTKKLLEEYISVFNKNFSNKSIHSSYLAKSSVLNMNIEYENTIYKIINISENGELELSTKNHQINLSSNMISLTELYEE